MKKAISILLAAVMLLSLLAAAPVTANAAPVQGKVGDCDCFYYSDNHTLLIKNGNRVRQRKLPGAPERQAVSSVDITGVTPPEAGKAPAFRLKRIILKDCAEGLEQLECLW